MSKRRYSDAFASTDQRRTTGAISSTPSAFLQSPSESNCQDLTTQRESRNDASMHLARSGHTFGNLSFTGSAPIHLGDNVQINLYANDVQQQDLRKILYYENMNQRRANLESTTTAPMDWIWATEFGCWLRSEQPLFWISGKPGSGKFTLTKFLVSSSETMRLLETSSTKKWFILDFYFDFRSGNSTANSSLGLLRTLLFQLVDQCSEIDAFIRQRHNYALEGEWVHQESTLRTTICDALKMLDLSVCAFVDGLDEYTGRAKALMDTLLGVQACTGIKLCLASRPEEVISRVLSSYPGLKVQDHNSATMQAYIQSTSVQVLSKEEMSTLRPLWPKIEQAANGVLLWARFAADQLVEQCIGGATTSELATVLDAVPTQLEDVYQRMFERLDEKQKLHAAITAQLLIIHGSVEIESFFVYWCMITEDVDAQFSCDDSFSTKRFVARMYTLFGGLLEFTHIGGTFSRCLLDASGDAYDEVNFGYPGQCARDCSVRFVHKTLFTYLTQSRILSSKQVTIDAQLLSLTPTSLRLMMVQKGNIKLQLNIMKMKMFEEQSIKHEMPGWPDMTAAYIETHFRGQSLEVHWKHRFRSFLQAIQHLFDDSQFITADLATWNVLSLPVVQLHEFLCDMCRAELSLSDVPADIGNDARLLCVLMTHGAKQVVEYGFTKSRFASHYAVVEWLLQFARHRWHEVDRDHYFDLFLKDQRLRAHHVVLYFMSDCREPKFINKIRETCPSIALETIDHCLWYDHTDTNLLFCWLLYSGNYSHETERQHLNLLQDLGFLITAQVYPGGTVMQAMFDRSLRKDPAVSSRDFLTWHILWPFDETKFQLLLDAGYDLTDPDDYELVRRLIINFLASLREEMSSGPTITRFDPQELSCFDRFVHKVWKLSVHQALPLDLPPLISPLTLDAISPTDFWADEHRKIMRLIKESEAPSMEAGNSDTEQDAAVDGSVTNSSSSRQGSTQI
ncbi:hypothetical protein LTS08_008438 [Lithohypha guttulata]|nr:hypothetical protein LTS08_008438 [Lithohypha guttulata]